MVAMCVDAVYYRLQTNLAKFSQINGCIYNETYFCVLISNQVIIPHGEPVTVETFLAWRERFEAELALERAK